MSCYSFLMRPSQNTGKDFIRLVLLHSQIFMRRWPILLLAAIQLFHTFWKSNLHAWYYFYHDTTLHRDNSLFQIRPEANQNINANVLNIPHLCLKISYHLSSLYSYTSLSIADKQKQHSRSHNRQDSFCQIPYFGTRILTLGMNKSTVVLKWTTIMVFSIWDHG